MIRDLAPLSLAGKRKVDVAKLVEIRIENPLDRRTTNGSEKPYISRPAEVKHAMHVTADSDSEFGFKVWTDTERGSLC